MCYTQLQYTHDNTIAVYVMHNYNTIYITIYLQNANLSKAIEGILGYERQSLFTQVPVEKKKSVINRLL